MKVITDLVNELQILKFDCTIYIFGSYLYTECWADIDILIVYKNYGDVTKLKEVFSRNLPHTPLDLNFMTQEEEKYFNFINQTNAQQIFPRDNF
jgi:predicted nucleotidyltransferase